jgi:lysophospholipase L1-like esterase
MIGRLCASGRAVSRRITFQSLTVLACSCLCGGFTFALQAPQTPPGRDAIPAASKPAAAPKYTPNAAPLPNLVMARDPRLHYVGRFDASDSAGPRCDWAASAVTLRFIGTAVNVRLRESGNNDEYDVRLDRRPPWPLVAKYGTRLYRVYAGTSPGPHTLTLVKRTEPFFGTSQFEGFQIARGGRLLPPAPRSPRRLEVIGDSMSCGYGDEAENQKAHFSSTTENADLAYGAVAARAMDAEYFCIAWSGRLMWPKFTMGEIYDRTIATDPESVWDFSRWVPQAVVIALGGNDFRNRIPDENGWTVGYEAFIARVRRNYPAALIYCAPSPMLPADKDVALRADLHRIVQAENEKGDAQVKYLDFAPQKASDGYGADFHPSLKTHRIMASALSAALNKDLGWKL